MKWRKVQNKKGGGGESVKGALEANGGRMGSWGWGLNWGRVLRCRRIVMILFVK